MTLVALLVSMALAAAEESTAVSDAHLDILLTNGLLEWSNIPIVDQETRESRTMGAYVATTALESTDVVFIGKVTGLSLETFHFMRGGTTDYTLVTLSVEEPIVGPDSARVSLNEGAVVHFDRRTGETLVSGGVGEHTWFQFGDRVIMRGWRVPEPPDGRVGYLGDYHVTWVRFLGPGEEVLRISAVNYDGLSRNGEAQIPYHELLGGISRDFEQSPDSSTRLVGAIKALYRDWMPGVTVHD